MALNGQNSQLFFIDPIRLCLKSIQLIGMRLFFYIKEIRVNLLNKNSKNGHFSTKNGPKMALNGQNSQLFFIDPIRLCLKSIQLIGMRLFFYIKELQVNLLTKTLKMAIFLPKMALNGQNSQFFFIDPIRLCLKSIQLIGMRLFF